MTYTIKNTEQNQDNVNYIDMVTPFEEMPEFLNFEDVLQFSIKNGWVKDETEIKSLCDGGNHIEPYFSSNSAAFECSVEVENAGLKFDETISEYELF